MSDDIKIDYLKPPVQKMPSLLETMKKNKIPVFNFKKFSRPLTLKELADKQEVEKLHSDWAKVMREEAKNHIPSYNPDPNISKKFFQEVVETAERLNCKSEDLAAAMYRESHFDPQISSSSGKYKGLIQMDKQAFKLALEHAVKTGNKRIDPKMTYDKYAKLPREQQIKYAEAYLKFRIDEAGLTGKKLNGGQLYVLIHVPSHIDNPKEVKKHQAYIAKAKKVPSEINEI